MEIQIITPQFDRVDGRIVPDAIAQPEFFDWLKRQPDEKLRLFGLQEWDTGHWLLPAEWYDSIPDGTPLVSISGNKVEFSKGVTDNDRRFGCLAYGIVRGSRDVT